MTLRKITIDNSVKYIPFAKILMITNRRLFQTLENKTKNFHKTKKVLKL